MLYRSALLSYYRNRPPKKSENETTTTQADINNLKEQSISKNPKVEEFELEGERSKI